MTIAFLARLSRDAQPARSFGGGPPSPLRWYRIAEHSLLAVNDPTAVIVLPGGAGFIVGTLFHRYGPSEPVFRLEANDAEAIERTQGQHLVDRFWGRYVAVIRTRRQLLVLRDPSGALPCYYSVSRDDLVLATDPSMLFAPTGREPELDRAQLARALALGGFPEERTALEGVGQILPGTALRVLETEISTDTRWNPWEFVVEQLDSSAEEHAEKLRRSTQLCVSGWSKVAGRALLGVSGGLDSSIVAACLRSCGNDYACVTLATDDPLGDERSHSRALTSHLGCTLFEESYALEDVDLDSSSVRHLAKPFGRPDLRAYDRAILRAAKQIDAQAIFTGNGGDNVFYMSHSARPLADRFLSKGWSLGLLKTISDISLMTGANGANVIFHGVRACHGYPNGYVWKPELEFLTDPVIEALASNPISHPWLEQAGRYKLPAKSAHIAMLIRMYHSLDAYRERDGIPIFHPLTSQPLLETCLQIPAWLQCEQGFDRSVARKAFRSALPDVVVNRRTKGGPQGFSFQIFSNFREEMKDRLMNGFLAEERIVDRRAIEAAFGPSVKSRAGDIARLLMLVDAEAWIRHWRGMRQGPGSMSRDIPGIGNDGIRETLP